MEAVCGLFGKSRQAWYKARQEEERQDMEAMALLHRIRQLRQELPRCGVRKLYHLLQPFLALHGIRLGRDKCFELMREEGLLIRRRKSRKTTFSFHRFHTYENLAKEMQLTGPHQLWVSDITYLPIGAQCSYLSLITDAYSRKIVGWALREDLSARGPLQALTMALAQCPRPTGLVHHSDRGIQYCCHEYTQLLKKHGINISMTQNSDPYENALAERMNRTLKEEFLDYYFYPGHEKAVSAVEKAIHLYNHRRPHLSLSYRTPASVHAPPQGPASSASFHRQPLVLGP